MPQFHIDSDCQDALRALDHQLETFGSRAGRRYTLILIPESADESVYISKNGVPLPVDTSLTPNEAVKQAMEKRAVIVVGKERNRW